MDNPFTMDRILLSKQNYFKGVKMEYIIVNGTDEKSTEHYIKSFETGSACKLWIEKNLSISINWVFNLTGF